MKTSVFNILKWRRAIHLFLTPQQFSGPRLVCVLLLTFISSNTLALGLGTIRVDSGFGEPFQGSVEIFNAADHDENSIGVSIASTDVHAELGIVRAQYLNSLSLELVFSPSGTAEILISSITPLNDPYLEIALEMRWPEGRIVRDYTVLLNMPSVRAPLKDKVYVDESPEPVASPANVETNIPYSSLYSVGYGDTLSEIAERLENREVSLISATQTLEAHNVNLLDARGAAGLRAGDELHIPSKKTFSEFEHARNKTAQATTTSTASVTKTVTPDLVEKPSISDGAKPTPDEPTANKPASLGTPLALAETRLRGLGYASLQMKAAGETPNPVLVSGAAIAILEQLVSEQGDDASYGATQIGRLAEGLNEIADISREYQQRLAALEDATQANAHSLAVLTGSEQSIVGNDPSPSPPSSTNAVVRSALDAPQVAINESLMLDSSIVSESNESGLRWPIWLSVFAVTLATVVLLLRQRFNSLKDEHSAEPLLNTQPAPQNRNNAEPPSEQAASIIPAEELEDDDPEHDMLTEIPSTEDMPDTQGKSAFEETFFDEDIDSLDNTGPSIAENELHSNFDDELDEELKLINIFEEKLASESAVRSQIKEESADDESAYSQSEEFLDFIDDTNDSKDALEFFLDDENESEASGELIVETDDHLNSTAEDTDEALDGPDIQPPPSLATNTDISLGPSFSPKGEGQNTFAGYSETSGFDQINPAQVIGIVDKKLQAAKDAGQESTLFYIDIDQFDLLEKELGIVRAEKLAVAVAANIYERIENPITLRRFKQDGFVLLLSGGQNQKNLEFAQELSAAIASTPLEVHKETFFVTLSIGVVPVTSGFSESAEIIEIARDVIENVRADGAGSGGALLHTPDPATAHNEASIMRSGRKLLNDNAFLTVYQPITALKGDPLEFYEAKLKIAEHAQTDTLPEDLIERLGNTDLSTEIDCLNLNQGLRDLKHYLNSHVNTRLFVTISARTATDNFFKSWFEKTVFSEGIHPERLVLQMPENSAGRHLNSLIGFRDYAHGLGARICISQLDFQHIPEHALARLHPDFVQLHPQLTIDAQHEGTRDADKDRLKRGVDKLTDTLEKARPLCEKIIVPGVSQARLIPTLWPLSVDYIQGEYIHAESPAMDYEFDQAADN